MSTELSDFERPITDLGTRARVLYVLADPDDNGPSRDQDMLLFFLAKSLDRIHDNLWEKYQAVLAAGWDNAPTPLHSV